MFMQRWLILLFVISFLTTPLLQAVETQPASSTGAKAGVKATPAAAGVAADNPKLKPTSPKTDIFEVEADKVDFYRNKGEAFFQGNVKATRQGMIVKSKIMRMFYDNATKKVVKLTAEGNVSIQWQDRNATCNQATYMLNDKQLYLTGNVIMTRGEDRVACERFFMDELKDLQSCQGEPGKRVKIKGNVGEGGFEFPGTAPTGTTLAPKIPAPGKSSP
jgi:lipopolysaccharide transport protein LptA